MNRGLDTLEEDAGCLARLRQDIDLTESESESEADMSHCAESSAANRSDDDGISSDEDECEEDASSSLATGPWLLNTRSGWCHKTLQVMAGGIPSADGSRWGLACRPAAPLSAWYELRTLNPELGGFQPCGHAGSLSSPKAG